jgi:hypothetical protein
MYNFEVTEFVDDCEEIFSSNNNLKINDVTVSLGSYINNEFTCVKTTKSYNEAYETHDATFPHYIDFQKVNFTS